MITTLQIPQTIFTFILRKPIKTIVLAAFFIFSGELTKAQTIATDPIAGSPFCAGNNFDITYTTSAAFNANNMFFAELSDSLGSFVNALQIGAVSLTSSGTISIV